MTNGDDKVEKQIEFKYIFDDDYRPVYANGAYGGINCRGEIIMHFFTERYALPKSMFNEVKEDNTVGDCVRIEPADMPIVRTISGGVILSRQSAQEIYDWLGTVLKQ